MSHNGTHMMGFAFVSSAAEREYKKQPEAIQDTFGKALRVIQYHEKPENLPIEYLDSVGAGVVELKINGSPAYRCVYVTKYQNAVIILHTFVKTTEGVDQKAMAVARKRLKELKSELGIPA